MPSQSIYELREEYKKIVSAIVLNDTLLGLFAKRITVVINNNIPTLATDGKKIMINPEFFGKLKQNEKASVIAHEVMHIIEMHAYRNKKYNKMLFNIVADAKINTALRDESFTLPDGAIFCHHLQQYGISLGDCKKLSIEEIIQEISKNNMNNNVIKNLKNKMFDDVDNNNNSDQSCNSQNSESNNEQNKENQQNSSSSNKNENKDGSGNKDGNKDGNASQNQQNNSSGGGSDSNDNENNTINKGDLTPTSQKNSEEEEDEMRRKILETLMTAKLIGLGKGWAERVIDELSKSKIDWKRLLATSLKTANRVTRTWSRENRKIDEMPGKKLYGKGLVVAIVDVSGSIGGDILIKFISEVYGIVKFSSKVILITFDDGVRDVFEIRNANDIKKIRITGGGGTQINDALSVLDKKYSNADKVVILSDWEIFDINTASKLLQKYKNKIIAVTTDTMPPKYLKTIKIQ